MSIKKFSLIGFACVAMVASAFSQQFIGRSFLSDNQAIWLTNLTTTTYGGVNIPYTNAVGGAVYSLTNLYSTNSLIAPGTIYTNANVYYGQAWYDVQGFSDRNGNNASASIAVSGIGSTAQSTNSLTFLFVKMLKISSSGAITVPSTDTNSVFTFSIVPNGTTAVGVVTNVPTAFMQGAAGIRLQKVVSADNGAAGGFYLQNVLLNGYNSVQ